MEIRLNKVTPGPQVVVKKNIWGSAFFLSLFVFVFFSFIHAFSKANGISFFPGIKLFSLDQTLSALVAITAILVTRKQVADSLKPYLAYEGKIAKDSRLNVTLGEGDQLFRITLKNQGNGSAYFKSCQYHIVFENQEKQNYELNYAEIQDQLGASNGISQEGIAVLEISSGYALPKEKELTIFECRFDVMANLKLLDITVEFQGTVGDTYSKDIFCVPRTKNLKFAGLMKEVVPPAQPQSETVPGQS